MIEPGQNLSDKQLKYSYWYLLHKKEIKKVGLGFLVAFDIVMVLWVIFGLVKFLNNYSELNTLATAAPDYIDWQTYRQENNPKDLIVLSPITLKTVSGKTDIGVLVKNNNAKWGVQKMTYQFVLAGGQTTPIQETFFLPDEEKYLLALGVETIGTTASLQIINLSWRSLKYGEDFSLPVNISNETFVPASRIEGQDLGGQASWRVDNNSSFSFYDPGFIVVLYSGSREVAFNYIQLNSLDSLSTRELTVSWGHNLPNVTSLRIMPQINLFDADIIK